MKSYLPNNRKFWCMLGVIGAILTVCIAVGLWVGLMHYDVEEPLKDYRLGHGAVVSNGIECAKIGSDILLQNGSVADAAIATLFCEGVSCAQCMGIGGGFLLTIYTKSTGIIETLNARETAPAASHKDMFVNETEVIGAKSIAVPGELKGYWALHQRYGKLPWRTLIQPTIDLCRNGHSVSEYMASALHKRESIILATPSLKEIFINPVTNHVWKHGDKIKRLVLAETLEIIAEHGVDTFYAKNGTIAQRLIPELLKLGGIITYDDLQAYNVIWSKSIVTKLNNRNLYSVPLPGSGSILAFILNVLNGFLSSENYDIVNYQRFVEALKYAFAMRTYLGDPNFVVDADLNEQIISDPSFALHIRSKIEDNRTYQDYQHYGANYTMTEDHGTAHISILAPNGDAVSVTSTINTVLGSKIRSRTTGIILNNQMDDFSIPNIKNSFGVSASPANFIEPGKRPMSSMCPAIIIDENGDVELIIGGAGGTKITSSVAYLIIRHMWFNESLESAMSAKRIHHQLVPMRIDYEETFSETIINGLAKIGHQINKIYAESGFAAANGISLKNGYIEAAFDKRRNGSVVII